MCPTRRSTGHRDPSSKHSRHRLHGECSIRSRPIGKHNDNRAAWERTKVFELGSKANGDDDGGSSMINDGGGDPMTLAKASRLLSTFWSMAYPYYHESRPGRRLFYGMILLTLVNSAVSVMFSYIGKDFWNALSSKDAAEFYVMMIKFGGALIVGAPVSVLYR